MDDSGTDVVLGVGVDALQEGEPESDELRLHLSRVHGLAGLEDLLGLLAGPAEGRKKILIPLMTLKIVHRY